MTSVSGPYQGPRTVIGPFDRKSLEDAYFDRSPGEEVAIWSPAEIRFLGRVSPLTVQTINDAGYDFPFSSEGLIEQGKALGAFLSLTIDNSVLKGIVRPGMVRSKIENLERLSRIVGEPCAVSVADMTGDNLIDMAYEVKRETLRLLRRFDRPFESFTDLAPSPSPPFYGFLNDLLGGAIVSAVEYGSSVNGGGKDIDLMAFVREFPRRFYDDLAGKADRIPSDKPVGIVLLPIEMLSVYAECDYNSSAIANGRLFGEPLRFPLLSDEERIRKTYFKAGKELTSLRGALREHERAAQMASSPNFLRQTLKLEIWIRRGLLQVERSTTLTKDEVLAAEPVPIPDLDGPVPLEVAQRLLLDANYRVAERIARHESLVIGSSLRPAPLDVLDDLDQFR